MRPWFVIVSALVGCGDPEDSDTGPVDTDTGPDAVCTEVKDAECVDQMILDLSLHDDKVSDGDVDTTQDGEDFVTTVDASAGGYSQASNNPWVYIRFTPDGAERVDIDDETALESMEWHLAARRFILRTNGGDNAPSCVGVTSFLEKEYEEVTEVPAGTQYYSDDFYTDSCAIVNDSSGLPGSPQVAMAPWWSYQDCVQTTGTPMLLQLDDGHVIKLVVEKYYKTEAQQTGCNEGDPDMSAEGGYFTFRWRYLE